MNWLTLQNNLGELANTMQLLRNVDRNDKITQTKSCGKITEFS